MVMEAPLTHLIEPEIPELSGLETPARIKCAPETVALGTFRINAVRRVHGGGRPCLKFNGVVHEADRIAFFDVHGRWLVALFRIGDHDDRFAEDFLFLLDGSRGLFFAGSAKTF